MTAQWRCHRPVAARPYVLLRDAMRETGQVAIARAVIRTRENLAILRPRGEPHGGRPAGYPGAIGLEVLRAGRARREPREECAGL
ncbi:Ku protein [Streptomyces sp. 8N706]|uniref:Ku protein n=1 Tax=Streptomyces sp. 8N706 TaxID=3457416 RepID=UPI003FD5D8A1